MKSITTELATIRQHADAGDESAKKYLAILLACIGVLNDAEGISSARGLVGEHNDVYDQAIDEAMGLLVPIMANAVQGFEALKVYLQS